MAAELVHIGFGNVLAVNHVVGIATPNSAPIKRLIQEGKAKNQIIDMTSGRKTKAVVFLDTGGIILAAITPETIAGRVQSARQMEAAPSAAE